MNISELFSLLGFKRTNYPWTYSGIFITGKLDLFDYNTGFVYGKLFLTEELLVVLRFTTIDDGAVRGSFFAKNSEEGEKAIKQIFAYFQDYPSLESIEEMNESFRMWKIPLYLVRE